MKVLTNLSLWMWRIINLSLIGVLVVVMLGSAAVLKDLLPHSDANLGYRNFSYGRDWQSGSQTEIPEGTQSPRAKDLDLLLGPSGKDPESKVWWNDEHWWSSLYNVDTQHYHIYQLDLDTQRWIDTGTALDDRPRSRADTLWDEAAQKLYVVSHVFTADTLSEENGGRLYRYSYDRETKSYSLDAEFPVEVMQSNSPTLVITKDTTGRLWVVYTQNGKVMVNHTTTSDHIWGTPFALPVSQGATNLKNRDVASIIAFDGHVGILWSNQKDLTMYFAAHADAEADTSWTSFALDIPYVAGSDDHINVKVDNDGTGIYAVTKTNSADESAPSIVLLVCRSGCTSLSNWQTHTVYQHRDKQTRGVLLLDTEQRNIHVFTSPEDGGGIYHKVSDMDTIFFPTGQGELFIKTAVDRWINDASSTKQNVNRQTGLVVLASDLTTSYYVHNYLSLDEPDIAANNTDQKETDAAP